MTVVFDAPPPATEPLKLEAPKRESLADMVRRLIDEIVALVRSEVELVRSEVRDSVVRATGSLAAVAVGGMLAMVATSCLLVATIAWLAEHVGLVYAALIVAGVLGAIAAILIVGGIGRLKRIDLAPKRAAANLKRNVESLKGD